MGARAQVFVTDGTKNGHPRDSQDMDGVYLYTHWGAGTIVQNTIDALRSEKGQARLNDTEYLTRIIFDELKGDDMGETGFGIGISQHGDIEVLVTVNTGEGYVDIDYFYEPNKNERRLFEQIVR